MMKNLKWLWVILCILGLIGVRFIEKDFFYDPFLSYFKNSQKIFPEFDWIKLIFSHLLRFSLNLIFSLGIVHFIFNNKKWTSEAGILILLAFIIFFPIYLYCIYTEFSFGHLFSFYIRRFVIQPLAILLIVPLFYHRLNSQKK